MKKSHFSKYIHQIILLGLLAPTATMLGQKPLHKRALAGAEQTNGSAKETSINRLNRELKLFKEGTKAALKFARGKSLSAEEKQNFNSLSKRAGGIITLILAAIAGTAVYLYWKKPTPTPPPTPPAPTLPQKKLKKATLEIPPPPSYEQVELEAKQEEIVQKRQELEARKEEIARKRQELEARKEKDKEIAAFLQKKAAVEKRRAELEARKEALRKRKEEEENKKALAKVLQRKKEAKKRMKEETKKKPTTPTTKEKLLITTT